METIFMNNGRLYLRAVEPDDLDLVYGMENEPSLWSVSSFTVPYSRYMLKQYIVATKSDVFADKQLRLMIVRKADHKVLGTIDLTEFEPLHMRAAVGIAIHHNYRHEGYAADAVELICQYAFEFLQFHSLYAYISTENQSSIALFKACGFEQSGLLREWLRTHQGYVDAVIMQRITDRR